MFDYEKLGLFYLGKHYDLATREVRPEPLLYESKDLTTHAVCVGMTGSGKTGLCLALIEEAAIDRIPVIAIDPKGDLGNLLLSFPELRPEDFRPWVDPDEARRQQKTVEELAAETATRWREGLDQWHQDPARIGMLREAVDLSIYTPGSTAGLPLSVLRSFHAPSQAVRDDLELYRDQIQATASSVLAMIGIEADPLSSREHLLLTTLLDATWSQGRDLDLESLLHGIQKPPFDKVGMLDLEAFFPSKDRFALAIRLNNLIASPGFAAWREGEPLDIQRLLYRGDQPRVSILSIQHLSDAERMSFVTLLLNEVLSWIRSQPGTSSLRAILYMDEIFGYFPPSASPPSKKPMLTLLKQARAYGLGVVLATQNPVDLDYKGLSNAGTWFLGRLQTERDKARVLDGLEGASAAAGASFDRKTIESTLSALGSRVFLMNNVHEDRPVVFQTRWALSYLRGPLTRDQIQDLMRDRKAQGEPGGSAAPSSTPVASVEAEAPAGSASPAVAAATARPAPSTAASSRPVVPPGIPEFFAQPTSVVLPGESLFYRPGLLGTAQLHYVDKKAVLDEWRKLVLLTRGDSLGPTDDIWAGAVLVNHEIELEGAPASGTVAFADLPGHLARPKNYGGWAKRLKEHLVRDQALELWTCPPLKLYSWPGEAETDFRIRVGMKTREQRDAEVEKLRTKFRPKLDALEDKIRQAREKVARQQAQASQTTFDAAVSFGGSLLDALMGKGRSRSRGRSTAAARSASRAAQKRSEAAAATDSLDALYLKRGELESDLQREVLELESELAAIPQTIARYPVAPRRTEITVDPVRLIWLPYKRSATGQETPAF